MRLETVIKGQHLLLVFPQAQTVRLVLFQEVCEGLLGVGRGAHQHQNALLFVDVVFQTNPQMNAVGPDVNVLLAAQVSLAPGVVFAGLLFFQPDDDVGTEALVALADQDLQRLVEVTRADAFEVQPGDELLDRRRSPQVRRQHRRRESDSLYWVGRVFSHAALLHFDRPRPGENLSLGQVIILDDLEAFPLAATVADDYRPRR